MEENKDCKVCEKLIKEKHKYDIWWKVFAIVFLALSIVLAILYFGSGAMITETHIDIENVGNDNELGADGNIIIGSQDTNIDGTIEKTDYTPIICITVIAAAAVITAGGIVIANNHKKDN